MEIYHKILPPAGITQSKTPDCVNLPTKILDKVMIICLWVTTRVSKDPYLDLFDTCILFGHALSCFVFYLVHFWKWSKSPFVILRFPMDYNLPQYTICGNPQKILDLAESKSNSLT